jgi:hypothetical protein
MPADHVGFSGLTSHCQTDRRAKGRVRLQQKQRREEVGWIREVRADQR